MHSVEQIKDVLAFALSMHRAYEMAKADGKINMMDFPLLIDPLMKLVKAVDKISDVPAELKDMSSEERAELMAWAQAEYDIKDDEMEAKVEGGLDLVLHLAAYLGTVGVYGPKDPEPPSAA